MGQEADLCDLFGGTLTFVTFVTSGSALALSSQPAREREIGGLFRPNLRTLSVKKKASPPSIEIS